MSDDPKAITYTFDEARNRLRNPPPSRTAMYGMINEGVLKVAGFMGDRPFFTDRELEDCVEQLKRRQQSRVRANLLLDAERQDIFPPVAQAESAMCGEVRSRQGKPAKRQRKVPDAE
jgi:hypothetical protein